MIYIDGYQYKASWITNEFEQTADILNGDDSGRLQGTKSMYLEYIGTFFNSTGTLHRDKNCSDAEWDELYRMLSHPKNDHVISVPFDQGYLTTKMYISKVSRKLVNTQNERHKWDASYSVQFVSMNAQWLYGQSLQGYRKGV